MLRKREFCVLNHLTLIVNIQDFVAGRGKQGVELESNGRVLRLCWSMCVCHDYFGIVHGREAVSESNTQQKYQETLFKIYHVSIMLGY